MSKDKGDERVVVWRPSDEVVRNAVEIALAQLGNHYGQGHFLPLTIVGNKGTGTLRVTGPGLYAVVHCFGAGREEGQDHLFSINDVEVYRVNGESFAFGPKIVKFRRFEDGENHLYTLQMRHTRARETVVFNAAMSASGTMTADAILRSLWTYPEIHHESDGLFRLTYETNALKIEVWWNSQGGFSAVRFSGKMDDKKPEDTTMYCNQDGQWSTKLCVYS
jgi:hypothetical protein